MPAHQGGPGASAGAVDLLGAAAYSADVSEIGGFEYLYDPGPALGAAQSAAARIFGAARSWFLVNGATVGNLAAILSTVGDGEEILVARASHRSVYAGIALAGAVPRYLPPVARDDLDGLFGLDPDDVRRSLAEHPQIRAVHVTNPSYYGFAIDIAPIAEAARHAGVPLIVDEAHGSHWVFDDRFPPSALGLGADLVVHSPHKTLGSLTQSSLLHASGDRVDTDAVGRYLQMLESSSPSSLLLVSLDFAIDEMARHGTERWARAIDLANGARATINRTGPLRAYGDEIVGAPGIVDYDPTKIVVDVAGLATTGYAAASWLRAHAKIGSEFADLRRVVFSVTFADSADSIALLTDALAALAADGGGATAAEATVSRWPAAIPDAALTPRVAQAAAAEAVPLDRAAGRIAAEMVVPYPPGVPLLIPGARISPAAIAAIGQFVEMRSRIVGVADASLATIGCVAES
jgi:arginine decarboxylase